MDNVVTSEVRLSFVNAFKPQRAIKPGDKEKFGVVALFPDPSTLTGASLAAYNDTMSKLKMAAQEAATEKWGDKIPKPLRSPFRNQGDKDYEGYIDGAIFVTATSEQRPGIVDAQLQDIIDPSQLYSGCYARLSLRAFAYGGAGTTYAPGVSFGLQNIQKLRDGDSLGGRTRPQDDFEPIGDAAAAAGPAGAGGLFD